MFSIRFLSCAVMITLASATLQQANALSVDDKTMNNGDSTRFADPDERTPSSMINMNGNSPSDSLQGNKESATGAVDNSSIRYDYDKDSGTFVPHTK